MARNIGVRFWIPFASNNMERIVTDGFRDVQRFSADWHADNFAGATVRRVSRAMNAYDRSRTRMVWYMLPAAVVLIGVTVLTFVQWPVIGALHGRGHRGVPAVGLSDGPLLHRRRLAPLHQGRHRDRRGAGGRGVVERDGEVVRRRSARAERGSTRVVGAWTSRGQPHLAALSTNSWVLQNMLLFILQAGLLGPRAAGMEQRPRDARATRCSRSPRSCWCPAICGRSARTCRTCRRASPTSRTSSPTRSRRRTWSIAPTRSASRRGAGHIAFDAVSFGYKNAAEALYSDFSLEIAPGETVALVGPTGSGKSTFVKLVQRLYDVDAGAIRIDGQDVRAVTQASLRQRIALVPQDPALFHRSLRENIAYAGRTRRWRRSSTRAKRARAHDFIEKLPFGYDTEVGERGVKLSGGERQRVALARAFLADAPILILDEATSSLDVETEREVQAAMAELKQGRTTIVIAHRLSAPCAKPTASWCSTRAASSSRASTPNSSRRAGFMRGSTRWRWGTSSTRRLDRRGLGFRTGVAVPGLSQGGR